MRPTVGYGRKDAGSIPGGGGRAASPPWNSGVFSSRNSGMRMSTLLPRLAWLKNKKEQMSRDQGEGGGERSGRGEGVEQQVRRTECCNQITFSTKGNKKKPGGCAQRELHPYTQLFPPFKKPKHKIVLTWA